MGDVIRFPGEGDENWNWEQMEEYLLGYLKAIFHSEEKRNKIIARIKDYYDSSWKLEYSLTFHSLDIYPSEQQKAMMEAVAVAEGDIRELVTKILRPAMSQGLLDLLQKEIVLQLNDKR